MGFSIAGVGQYLVPFLGGAGVAAPVADFEANLTTLQEPTLMTVEFTDLSTNSPTSWLWDFGDGDTSTDQNPSHTYTEAGTFTVSLTATNAGGDDTETKTDYITATAWYVVDGIAPLAAYRAKGAASYAASKVNLGSGGIAYDLTEGNGVVAWDATNGWQFVAAQSKYFDTGIVPTNDQSWSALLQFASVALGQDAYLLAVADTPIFRLRYDRDGDDRYIYSSGGNLIVNHTQTAGNMAFAGTKGYYNGSQDAGSIGSAGGSFSRSIYIGAQSQAVVAGFFTGNVLAVIIHNATYTPAQVATLAANMAAL